MTDDPEYRHAKCLPKQETVLAHTKKLRHASRDRPHGPQRAFCRNVACQLLKFLWGEVHRRHRVRQGLDTYVPEASLAGGARKISDEHVLFEHSEISHRRSG